MSKVIGGAELTSIATNITLKVPVDTYNPSTAFYGGSNTPASSPSRGEYKYVVTLEEAEAIAVALEDAIFQARKLKSFLAEA